MGWFDDAVDAAKSAGGGLATALDKTSDVLVDKESWGDVLSGNASWSDIANVALDSTALVPGVGLLGGGARIATRQAAKALGREAAENAAKKTAARTALRSPANNAVRGKLDDVLGLSTRGATARSGLKVGTQKEVAEKLTGQALMKGASRGTPGPARAQMARIAAKKDAGIGRRVGFGQSKRRVMGNAMMSGGANLLTRGYDMGMLGGGDDNGKGAGKGDGGPGGAGGAGGAGAGGPGFYFAVSGGDPVPVPNAYFKDPAAFMAQNGLARGTQIFYME